MTTKQTLMAHNTSLRNAEYYGMTSIYDNLYNRAHKNQNFNHLMATISSRDNILLAYRNIKSNQGSTTAGADGLTIKDVEQLNDDEFITKIRNRLRNYQPKAVRQVAITKKDGGKRILGIPSIWDRLIQQCVLQVMEPICEAHFYTKSYGFRPNRSAENAIGECYSKINQNQMRYAVNVDIKGFFDEVNHQKLMRQLWTMGFHDKQLMVILRKMLKAPVIGVQGNISKPTKGTPQGAIISPLLANVNLNEFDWWVAEQWEIFKADRWNPVVENGPTTHAKMRYVLKQEGVTLKPIFMVRYADDFRLFTDTEEHARRIFHACKDWLETRLKLPISTTKSKIVNLKTDGCEFLGFTIKASKKGKEKNENPKYVATSNISSDAMSGIKQSLQNQIKIIQKSPNSKTTIENVAKYNSLVIGIHNYYRIATQVSSDLNNIAISTERRQFNRWPKSRNMNKYEGGFSRVGSYTGSDKGYKPYLKSKMLRYLNGQPIIPIGYVQFKPPMRKNRSINKYTEEGRKTLVAKQTSVSDKTLKYLRDHPILNSHYSISYNDHRLARVIAQKGRCAVTGVMMDVKEMHCHHIKPWHKCRDDSYQNLIIVLNDVHRLIHAKTPETILKLKLELCLTKSQLTKINVYRVKAGNSEI